MLLFLPSDRIWFQLCVFSKSSFQFLYSGRFLKVFFSLWRYFVLHSQFPFPRQFDSECSENCRGYFSLTHSDGQRDADSNLLYFRRACKICKSVEATLKQAENPLIIVSQCWQRGCETRCFALVGVIFGLCWDSALFSQMRESAVWETPGMQVFACLTAYVCCSVLWGRCGRVAPLKVSTFCVLWINSHQILLEKLNMRQITISTRKSVKVWNHFPPSQVVKEKPHGLVI